ncbi:MAG: 50S ribosomal protein L3 [Patescibacteria group bacterium]|nr:50S ribosomal protein L3 [Patescibacteria group bacterium]MDE2015554.1 50S ribosomal protein L3 [Patescibacteria group bacterium]MDE2227250.1 50S ribosomal protein L3 [Patescibacteria group bacterium]
MFILGRKLKMSQIWKDNKVVPITVIKAEPNKVSLVRTKERDGYEAVQVSLGKKKIEFRGGEYKQGDEFGVDVFQEGDVVRVSGLMKGRGFQGTVKRHGFGGGPKTHGQKNRYRAGGSIGSTAPQRVIPGRRMAGHMGDERVTIKNLKVAGVDKENNLLMIKGAVPGARGGLLEIQKIK